MIDRDRVRDLAEESAGLDRLEQFLAEARSGIDALAADLRRIAATLAAPGAAADPAAYALAADWADTRSAWRERTGAWARSTLAELDRHRAILEADDAGLGTGRRKVHARRRARLDAAEALRAELAGWLAAIDRSAAELAAMTAGTPWSVAAAASPGDDGPIGCGVIDVRL